MLPQSGPRFIKPKVVGGFRGDRRGNVMMLAAVSMVPMAGAAGLAMSFVPVIMFLLLGVVAAPIVPMLVIGMMQVGIMFQASAGMKYAPDEAARYAVIYPTPSDPDILSRFASRRFGLDPSRVTVAVVHGTASSGVDYTDISATYPVELNFVFFSLPSITIRDSRRAFQSA